MFWGLALLAVAAWDAPVDTVVVCPVAWRPAMQPWVEWRESQGHRIEFIDRDPNPYVIRDRIRNVAERHDQTLRFVVLVGDAPKVNAPSDDGVSLPPFYTNAKAVHLFGGDRTTSTDFFFGEFNDDLEVDLAVGRIPVRSSEELSAFLSKVLDYERSTDFGEWRRTIDVTAGVGGFGLLADTAIELATRRLLCEGIPEHFHLRMTQASPLSLFCPPPRDFGKQVLNNLNEGSLFWVYIGHGHVRTLDRLRIEDRTFRILDEGSLPEVNVQCGPPIAVFLACYTGAFDADVDCLAEQLVRLPNGPVATLAGSRVTMPYGMSVLAAHMLDACFLEREATIGEILMRGKQRSMLQTPPDDDPLSRQNILDAIAETLSPPGHSLAAEREDHLYLINLLGDPMMRIPHPKEMSLDVPTKAKAGETIVVRGEVPESGRLRIELVLSRDRDPPQLSKRPFYLDQDEIHEEMIRTYQAANLRTIFEVERDVGSGQFEVELTLPEDAFGKHFIRCFLCGKQCWSAHSKPIQARRLRAVNVVR